MTIAFLIKTPEVINFYHFPLLQEGYKVCGFSEPEKLTDYLEKNECQLLVVDYEDYLTLSDELLGKIRLLSEKIQIILVTLANYFKIKHLLEKYKVYGVISKPTPYPKILERIREYIELIEKKPLHTLRKYPRFAIHDKNKSIVKINFKDLNASYIGKLTDISLGGIGVLLNKDINKYLVFKGKKCEAIIETDNLSIDFKGDIVNTDDKKKIGLAYKLITPQNLNKVKEFILNLMSTDKK